MRWAKPILVLIATFWASALALGAAGKVIKVLPHHLDKQGRHTLSPSLYERDSYQAHLRRHREECSGLRFEVQWKGEPDRNLKLRVQMRGTRGKESTKTTLESDVTRRGLFSQWSALTLQGEDFKNFGELIAWRATLWDGDVMVAEQKSFLW